MDQIRSCRRLTPAAMFVCFVGVCGVSRAQTPTEAVVTNVHVGHCNDPHPSIASFLPTDSMAEVFLNFANPPSGSMSLKWFGPSSMIDGGSWTLGSSTCFVSDLSIAGTSVANQVGSWRVEVYLNGSTIVNVPFRISAAQSGSQSLDGSFDPISTDCSHFDGWALDRNNPGSSIGVDIVVSGFPKVTVTANQARSDLTGTLANHAWNDFDLSAYKNGQTLSVNAYYAGTSQNLPGSPRQFPPSGSQLSSCGVLIRGPQVTPITFGQTLNGTLGSSDGRSSQGARNGAFADQYTFSGTAGAGVTIAMNATFDSYLYLLKDGVVVAQDDDSGGNRQARIPASGAFSLPSSGTYIIEATSYSPSTIGPYTISLAGVSNQPPSGRNIWVYSADGTRTLRTPVQSQLQDFFVVAEKIPLSGGATDYMITVLGDNTIAIVSSTLTVVRPHGVNLSELASNLYVHRNVPGVLQLILANNNSGWMDLSQRLPLLQWQDSTFNYFKDLVGLLPYPGTAIGVAATIGDINDMFGQAQTLVPTPDFSSRLRNNNEYHHDSFAATRLEFPTFGVQYRFRVYDSADQPWLFLTAKNNRGTYIAIELGNDLGAPRATPTRY